MMTISLLRPSEFDPTMETESILLVRTNERLSLSIIAFLRVLILDY